MKNRNLLAPAGALLGVVVIALGLLGLGDHAARTVDPAVPVVQPGLRSGMVTYIDPDTGERLAAPPAGFTPRLGDAVDTSDDGLVQKPSPVPGGGMMIELDGRFQNAAVVRAGTDSATAVCEPASKVRHEQGGER